MARWVWAIVAVTLVLLSLGTIVLVKWLTPRAAVLELPAAIVEVEPVPDAPTAVVTTTTTEATFQSFSIQSTRVWHTGSSRTVTAKFLTDSTPVVSTVITRWSDGTVVTPDESVVSGSLVTVTVPNAFILAGWQATGVLARTPEANMYRSMSEVVVDDRGHGLLFYNPPAEARADSELWVYDMHTQSSALFTTSCWEFSTHWRDRRMYVAVMAGTKDKITIYMGPRVGTMKTVELAFDFSALPDDSRVLLAASRTHLMVYCRDNRNVTAYVVSDATSSITQVIPTVDASWSHGSEDMDVVYDEAEDRFWFGVADQVFTTAPPFDSFQNAGYVRSTDVGEWTASSNHMHTTLAAGNGMCFLITTSPTDYLLLWGRSTSVVSWSHLVVSSTPCVGVAMRMYQDDLYIVYFESTNRKIRVAVCAGPNYNAVGASSDLFSHTVDTSTKVWIDRQGLGVTLHADDNTVYWAPLWPVLSVAGDVSSGTTTVSNYTVSGQPMYYADD
jgi:hypothetical protein